MCRWVTLPCQAMCHRQSAYKYLSSSRACNEPPFVSSVRYYGRSQRDQDRRLLASPCLAEELRHSTAPAQDWIRVALQQLAPSNRGIQSFDQGSSHAVVSPL